jgi:hypothetical protein
VRRSPFEMAYLPLTMACDSAINTHLQAETSHATGSSMTKRLSDCSTWRLRCAIVLDHASRNEQCQREVHADCHDDNSDVTVQGEHVPRGCRSREKTLGEREHGGAPLRDEADEHEHRELELARRAARQGVSHQGTGAGSGETASPV